MQSYEPGRRRSGSVGNAEILGKWEGNQRATGGVLQAVE